MLKVNELASLQKPNSRDLKHTETVDSNKKAKRITTKYALKHGPCVENMCAVRNAGKDLNHVNANHNKETLTAAIIVPRLTYEGMKSPKPFLTNTTELSKGKKDIRKSVPAPMTWTVLTKSPYLGNNGNTLETCRRSFFTPHQGTSLDTVKDTNNSGGPNKSEVERILQKRKPNRVTLYKILHDISQWKTQPDYTI